MTLVELMISMLILALVCVAWLEIIGIQSAKKEARRREAVERLSGRMDAFLHYAKSVAVSGVPVGCYSVTLKSGTIELAPGNAAVVNSVFDDGSSPIGYQLEVGDMKLAEVANFKGWGDNSRWLVGRLYNLSGRRVDVGKPFFTLSVCLGTK